MSSSVLEVGISGGDGCEEGRFRKRFMVFGIAGILLGAATALVVVYMLAVTGFHFYNGAVFDQPASALAIYVVNVVLIGVVSVMAIAVGVRLVMGKVRGAHLTSEIVSLLLCGCALCSLMLDGVSLTFFATLAIAGINAVMFDLADPALADERRLQRKLRDMEVRDEAREGTLGMDRSGKGLVAVNFFNLFWIFTVGMVVGDAVETVYHYMIEVPGEFQIRAGMLWGPFSPIYGFGAVLLTLVLNRFYRANVLVVFLVSALLGGAFEYAVSWFLEFAFGSVAWDYTGRFLNINGRTDFMFMCMWGFLGAMWIKVLLPWVAKVINMIPWKWRYTITTACAAFVIFDGVMTLMALDCWYLRLAGSDTGEVAVMQFFSDHFDNAYMESRFQSMSIHPELTSRVN